MLKAGQFKILLSFVRSSVKMVLNVKQNELKTLTTNKEVLK